MSRNRFLLWKNHQAATFSYSNIVVSIPEDALLSKEERELIIAISLESYHKANRLMEKSVGYAALQYTHENGNTQNPAEGPILQFARKFSQRYLDLYKAYIQIEMDNGIPMLPVSCSFLKQRGFTSEDILRMGESSVIHEKITSDLFQHLVSNHAEKADDLFEEIMFRLTCKKSRLEWEKTETNFFLKNIIIQYNSMPEAELLDKVHLMLHTYGRKKFSEISSGLYFIAMMHEKKHFKKSASHRERLLMEIRHRIASEKRCNDPGSLGSNPLAYLNMLEKGEDGNLEAEFRERLYFIFMSNQFANACIKDEDTIKKINSWLIANNKGWQIDSEFVHALYAQGALHMDPIFRYAANASLNSAGIRLAISEDEIKKNHETALKKNPTIASMMESALPSGNLFNFILSSRELLHQTGEMKWDNTNPNRHINIVNFATGASNFKLAHDTNEIKNSAASDYIEVVKKLKLPVLAGISGTLDQAVTMAGLVGIGVSDDSIIRREELEMIRFAYLAFMVPVNDHSVHEIMQSATSFGLAYSAGPGYQQFIFPKGGALFIDHLEKIQNAQGMQLPDFYLSKEYVQILIDEIKKQSGLHSKPLSRL